MSKKSLFFISILGSFEIEFSWDFMVHILLEKKLRDIAIFRSGSLKPGSEITDFEYFTYSQDSAEEIERVRSLFPLINNENPAFIHDLPLEDSGSF